VGWTTFNDGGGSFRRCSGSKVRSDGGGAGGGSSSKHRIGTGGLDKVDHRRWRVGAGSLVLGQIRTG
jgi:hypothetical protein